MYLKIINESQLELLKQINGCLGKRKLPKEALRIVRMILDKESLGIHDYIALFLKPVKNDTTGICDKIRFYPYTRKKMNDFTKTGNPMKKQEGGFPMTAKVNEGCISCGACVAACPEVFRFNDDGVAEAYAGVAPEYEKPATEARDSCPVAVIDIKE